MVFDIFIVRKGGCWTAELTVLQLWDREILKEEQERV